MEMIFNPKAGEIYSLFTSLHYSWNINLHERQLEELGITLKEELKEEYYYINEIHSIKKQQMDFFFNSDSKIFKFFIIVEKIWGSKSINEYVSFIQNMSEDSLRIMLVKTLIDNKLKNDDEHIEKITKNKESVLDFTKGLDIGKELKWDLYCFIDNIEKYKYEFISLIKEYIPIFNKIFYKKSKLINEVNNNIMKNINSKGIEFIKAYTNNFISLNDYKKIYITSSYFDSYSIYFTLTNKMEHCYLVVGLYQQELVNKNDYIEKHLKVFKNLSDKTRFGIMKYILDNKRYGQEIANKFNISNASVSYHMNNLFSLNLVEITKQDNKVFYKLNKKTILQTIKFLGDELSL